MFQNKWKIPVKIIERNKQSIQYNFLLLFSTFIHKFTYRVIGQIPDGTNKEGGLSSYT